MKILQVCPVFPPEPWKFSSGVTNVTYYTSKELVKRGHDVTVYTSATQSTRKKMRHMKNPVTIDGITVYYFPYTLNYSTFYITPSIVPFMRDHLASYDMIHLQDGRTFQHIIAHHYARKYHIPYVLEAHGSMPLSIGKNSLKRVYDTICGHRILKDASQVIALTKTECSQYKSMGVDENNIAIVPNGIDISGYKDLPEKGTFRKKYSIEPAKKIILYLGRIHEIKGIDILVEAYASLRKRNPDTLLVIAGPDYGFLAALKKQFIARGITNNVLITGPLYGNDKLEAYVDADVYVLPSKYETFPVTVLEACTCGTPVVLTNRCGIADIIDGKCGIAVEYDAPELENALIKILDDRQLSSRFGMNGKRITESYFNWQFVVEQLEHVYRSITGE